MKQQVGIVKWTGMLLLQIPLYLVTSYVMRQLLGSCYGLLIKAGANLPANLLLQHFLFVAIVDGFLAGLLGVMTIRAMMLLPTRLNVALGSMWQRPQVWTWTVATCWFAFGLSVWIAANMHPSLLATSSGLKFSDAITVFFGRGCDLSDLDVDRSVFRACMTQLSYTHPWLGTIGYSAAAFVPVRWIGLPKNSQNSAEELAAYNEEQGQSENLGQEKH